MNIVGSEVYQFGGVGGTGGRGRTRGGDRGVGGRTRRGQRGWKEVCIPSARHFLTIKTIYSTRGASGGNASGLVGGVSEQYSNLSTAAFFVPPRPPSFSYEITITSLHFSRNSGCANPFDLN